MGCDKWPISGGGGGGCEHRKGGGSCALLWSDQHVGVKVGVDALGRRGREVPARDERLELRGVALLVPGAVPRRRWGWEVGRGQGQRANERVWTESWQQSIGAVGQQGSGGTERGGPYFSRAERRASSPEMMRSLRRPFSACETKPDRSRSETALGGARGGGRRVSEHTLITRTAHRTLS